MVQFSLCSSTVNALDLPISPSLSAVASRQYRPVWLPSEQLITHQKVCVFVLSYDLMSPLTAFVQIHAYLKERMRTSRIHTHTNNVSLTTTTESDPIGTIVLQLLELVCHYLPSDLAAQGGRMREGDDKRGER